VLEQEKEHNNANFTPSLLEEEEESLTAEGAAMVYESTITSVSNDEEKLTTTEDKEDDFGQKIKKAQNALQDLFTTQPLTRGNRLLQKKQKSLRL
jgi:hypothetical protein